VKYDILFAGVGGQGVLSMAAVIGRAAVDEGLRAKQSEVHGMAQRGGAVQAHLRIADDTIESDLVPLGTADLVLSLEPVEALRYLEYLSPDGALVTAADPYRNIADYPDVAPLLDRIRAMPHAVVVEAAKLATGAGDVQAVNTVMVGAASHVLPLPPESLEDAIVAMYAKKGPAVVELNRAAFRLGRAAAEAVGAGR
jgi:indolepyruvate ferredoxin oxidoreductase beta subunit